MPCAPQSISDGDQLYALVFGILSFLLFDVLPILCKRLKLRLKRLQENKASIEEIAARLREHELRRISAPELVRRYTPGMGV
jgi:hypothetical protein